MIFKKYAVIHVYYHPHPIILGGDPIYCWIQSCLINAINVMHEILHIVLHIDNEPLLQKTP